MKKIDDDDQDLLSWLGLKNRLDFSHNRLVGSFVGFFLSATFLILFLLAVIAAVAVLGSLLGSSSNATLGAGALITAMLGAPFLIWGTILKHQSVTFQKEGHMTDRINKAVEQLGVEKTVQRIGRSVTLVSELTEGATLGQLTSFKTIIEWQGDDFEPEQGWKVKDEGEWKVFSESVPNIEVRVGALLSLERIAQDSIRHDRGRDHIRVMEILCAYIRKNSPVESAIPIPTHLDIATKLNIYLQDGTGFLEAYKNVYQELGYGLDNTRLNACWNEKVTKSTREDIQIAILILGRRSKLQIQKEQITLGQKEANFPAQTDEYERSTRSHYDATSLIQSYNTMLSRNDRHYRLNLSGVDFQGYDLKGVDLSYAVLSNSKFGGSDISAANFTHCVLNNSTFTNSSLFSSDFSMAELSGSDFTSCNVISTKFIRANLTNCNFIYGEYFKCDLLASSLIGFRFISANVSQSHLHSICMCYDTNIMNCDFKRSKLYGLHFDSSCSFVLSPNYFSQNLRRHITRSAFRDIRFAEGATVDADFSKAFGDASVSLPSIIERPAHWPNWKLPDVGEHSYDNEYEKWRASPNYYLPPAEPQ